MKFSELKPEDLSKGEFMKKEVDAIRLIIAIILAFFWLVPKFKILLGSV